MSFFYKRPWDEKRGDAHDDWGTSVWFFEVAEDGFPVRQLEVYQTGIALRYDCTHLHDEFGMLSDASLDRAEFEPYMISADEFEQAWISHRPHNQS